MRELFKLSIVGGGGDSGCLLDQPITKGLLPTLNVEDSSRLLPSITNTSPVGHGFIYYPMCLLMFIAQNFEDNLHWVKRGIKLQMQIQTKIE